MQEFIAHEQDKGQRLDVFIARQLPHFSRSYLQKLCERQAVLVNSQPAKTNTKLKNGDNITIEIPDTQVVPQEFPVVYEDDDVIVINKPRGILTHTKGAFSEEFTIADYMRPRTTDNPDGNRPGIVHRLDRDTSGVIITAKHNEAKRWLQKQFSERKVKKTYIALVQGQPAEDVAILQLPIERNPKQPQTFRVGAGGKPAETAYTVKEKYAQYALVELKPTTGRTHQLRVHMKYLGCPIVGDPLYGRPEPALGRMFLHAAALEITLPSRERRIFSAPLPVELTAFLEKIAHG